jgi:hypothetical protein
VDREKKRLLRLEGEAAKRRRVVASSDRRRPRDYEVEYALDQGGWEAYYELYSRYGWSKEEVDQDLAWTKELARRCDESGLEGHEIIKDMCDFVDSLGLPLDQVMNAFDRYPGPSHWGREGANDQMPVQ